jgi:hypothetical protein
MVSSTVTVIRSSPVVANRQRSIAFIQPIATPVQASSRSGATTAKVSQEQCSRSCATRSTRWCCRRWQGARNHGQD